MLSTLWDRESCTIEIMLFDWLCFLGRHFCSIKCLYTKRMPESSRRKMSMSSEDAAHWASPAHDFLADSFINSKDAAEEKAKESMDSLQSAARGLHQHQTRNQRHHRSKAAGFWESRELWSCSLLFALSEGYALSSGPTPAKESVDVFGAGCMASLCHQHRSQSDESASRAVDLISENGDLQMLWTLLMGIEKEINKFLYD